MPLALVSMRQLYSSEYTFHTLVNTNFSRFFQQLIAEMESPCQ